MKETRDQRIAREIRENIIYPKGFKHMKMDTAAPITFTPAIQTMWAEYYPANKDAMRANLEACGWEIVENGPKVTIRFVEDAASAILYHGADPCCIVTIDWSEPCLKFTYVQA